MYVKNTSYLINKRVLFPSESFTEIDKNNLFLGSLKKKNYKDNNNKLHYGVILLKKGKFSIIDCLKCKFIHAVPFLEKSNIKNFYEKKFYNQNRKKDYFKHQKKDLDWWNKIFEERLSKFHKILKKKGTILDVGCGPGFFLNFAKKRGWKVNGIEPSIDAVNYGKKKLGIKINHGDLSLLKKFKNVDIVYTHGVLEHLEDPINFIKQAEKCLSKKGLIFTSVANDFNQIQFLALNHVKKPWWITPPEHYNYFNMTSIKRLMNRKFKIKDVSVSFPIDIFILMGQNYIKRKTLGKKIHNMRVLLESNLDLKGFFNLKKEIFKGFVNQKIGRQIDLICQKKI